MFPCRISNFVSVVTSFLHVTFFFVFWLRALYDLPGNVECGEGGWGKKWCFHFHAQFPILLQFLVFPYVFFWEGGWLRTLVGEKKSKNGIAMFPCPISDFVTVFRFYCHTSITSLVFLASHTLTMFTSRPPTLASFPPLDKSLLQSWQKPRLFAKNSRQPEHVGQ